MILSSTVWGAAQVISGAAPAVFRERAERPRSRPLNLEGRAGRRSQRRVAGRRRCPRRARGSRRAQTSRGLHAICPASCRDGGFRLVQVQGEWWVRRFRDDSCRPGCQTRTRRTRRSGSPPGFRVRFHFAVASTRTGGPRAGRRAYKLRLSARTPTQLRRRSGRQGPAV